MTNRGKVYLMGAGPGDPELLTLKAQKTLRTVDLALYDRPVSRGVLLAVNPAAELVYVGKQQGEQESAQRLICERTLDAALAGKTVARLKGGAPRIFGREAEEWLHLAGNGVEAEIAPGDSAAMAAPPLAGIPPTFRELSQGFAVVAGHGAGRARELVPAGRPAEEPAVFVEPSATPRGRVVQTTLGDVAAGTVEVESPPVFAGGAVVADRTEVRAQAIHEAVYR